MLNLSDLVPFHSGPVINNIIIFTCPWTSIKDINITLFLQAIQTWSGSIYIHIVQIGLSFKVLMLSSDFQAK